MAYVYRHIRLDTKQVFYVGIGSDEAGHHLRAKSKSKKTRNNHWFNIVNKTPYEIEIILDGLNWEEACKKEREFIAIYGRKDLGLGELVNKTDGGEGNHNLSNETKKLISTKVKKALSSSEVREKISNKGRGRIVSKETREKISMGNLGKKRIDVVEYNKTRSGKNHPYYGKSSPKKGKSDIKAKYRALEKVVCPFCKKEVQKIVASRWHFGNCKIKLLR